jgi:dipeptidyl aminopeptidase/acylaminoacyl peptidase
MLQATQRRAARLAHRCAFAAVGAFALAACATVHESRYDDVARRAEPSLEDIFLIPGIHGEAPRIESLSADGEWLLVRWRPVKHGDDGKRAWGDDLSPHLVATSSLARSLDESSSLRAELERLERAAHAHDGEPRVIDELDEWKPGKLGSLAWSERGHRLAIEWEHSIVVLDLDDGDVAHARRAVLYRDPEAKKEPPSSTPQVQVEASPNQGEGAKETTLPERLGDVRSLAFEHDDSELVVRTNDECFVFPITGDKAWPLALGDARWPTRDLDAGLDGVQSNRERTLYFSPTKALGKVEHLKDDGEIEKLDAQVADLAGGRRIVLDGMKGIASLETPSLSPDGHFVFACEVDHSKEPAPTLVPNYLTDRVTTLEGRRQLADDTWLPRKLWLWDTGDGTRTELALPGETTYAFQLLGWAPQDHVGAPARLAFRRTASDYRTAETWVWSEGDLAQVVTEHDERWVGGPGSFTRWSKDGRRLVFASECLAESSTPGHNQIFEVDVETRALRQLTAVEGEVSSYAMRDDGALVFTASRNDPARRALGVVDAAHRRASWITALPGTDESLRIASRGDLVVYEHEELGVPAEVFATAFDGSATHPLTRTIAAEYQHRAWTRPVSLSARHPDGTEIRSHVFLPHSSSLEHPDRARACIVFIHGAGYLQNVTDSMTEYSVNLLFHSRLASMGYVVLDVDYRGSSGYGSRFRGDVQNQLGKLELEDIAVIVDELGRRHVIDQQRVGCYGGSYGGFLTLMALFTQADRWACGAALRSVTDWRTYSPGYTQPRLGRPSLNPEAYKRSSPIDLAEGLRDPLLILHGMVDTNVFAQDSIRLIEKLIDLGLPFESQLYPSQGHAFEDGMHWLDEYKRIEHFMVEHLGAP